MDSTSTEVESSLDLNVLVLSKIRNNLTFGIQDTQITIERKEIVSFTHMSKTD